MRLHQRQERLPPLQAPIPTQMVVSAASVASVLVRCYGLLLKATSEHERPAAVAAIACTACVQQVQRGARDVHGLLIAALTATHGFGSTSHSVLYLPCAVPVAADLEQMTQSERHCSGSGSDASRSAIARVDSKCG